MTVAVMSVRRGRPRRRYAEGYVDGWRTHFEGARADHVDLDDGEAIALDDGEVDRTKIAIYRDGYVDCLTPKSEPPPVTP